MTRITVPVVNKSDNELPKYATPFSSGMDTRAFISETVNIPPGKRAIIQTGLFVDLPNGYEFQVRPRSGLALKMGVTILNTPGTIDADYRGEIGIVIINLGQDDFVVNSGDRIAQLVLQEVPKVQWEETDELSESNRGSGGFGSTGV
ncbi:dUTP diphosphatase [Ruminococcaceae bacterium OttesenSCG-928-A11]|nr:dUTP diphosphatase [Ruminococcaceae bacterium OttesenSCG-928-A11]